MAVLAATWLAATGLGGCGAATDGVASPAFAVAATPPAAGLPLVAVLPIDNLSGKPQPLEDVRQLLVERLQAHGVRVLDDAALERTITRHRVRYLAGVERGFARALGQETGAGAVLVPSLETYDEAPPFRAALFARLVSTADDPVLLWADGAGAAGDDAPGLLGIGVVDDPRVLLARVVDALAGRLARSGTAPEARGAAGPVAPRFRPKIVYRSELLDRGGPYSIAVVPFFNRSARSHGGELVALHLIRSLMGAGTVRVVEPGIVREELLRFRLIMTDGISLAETETILGATSADLVLNGEVLEYEDPRGALGAPQVDFSVLLIERRTRRVVFSAYSQNAGNDGVYLFDIGRVNTAHAMAARMATAIAERFLQGPPTAGGAAGTTRQETGR